LFKKCKFETVKTRDDVGKTTEVGSKYNGVTAIIIIIFILDLNIIIYNYRALRGSIGFPRF